MEEWETEHPLPTPAQSLLVSNCLSSRGQIGAAIAGIKLEAFSQYFLPPDSKVLGDDLATPIKKKAQTSAEGGRGTTYLCQSHLSLNVADTYFKWSHLSLIHSNNRMGQISVFQKRRSRNCEASFLMPHSRSVVE